MRVALQPEKGVLAGKSQKALSGQYIWRKVLVISLFLALTNTALTFAQELPLRIGDEKNTVINRLGDPGKTKLFNSGTERLFYNDLLVDLRDNKVAIIRSTNYKGAIFSVRLGDPAYRVIKLLGEPDESDEKELVYYDYQDNYLRFNLDEAKRCVSAFFLKAGSSKEEMAKRKKQLASLAERGLIPSEEELRSNLRRRVAHESVTEKEYRRRKYDGQRGATEYHTITGLLKDKNSPLSPVELSHDIGDRMNKFVVEYKATEGGVTKRILQDCFLDRYVTSLKMKLASLSVGDRVTVRGRWKYLENKQKIEKENLNIEQRMSMSIFLVDQIQ